ncbi:hypothetical protein NPIL_327441, partial [Nephila pilipes]
MPDKSWSSRNRGARVDFGP